MNSYEVNHSEMSDKSALMSVLETHFVSKSAAMDQSLASLSHLFRPKIYTRKSLLVRANEKWDRVFFIHRGMIRLFYTDIKGREFNKGFFTEHQLVWPVAPCAREQPSLFSIAALEETHVSVCDFSAFQSWLMDREMWSTFALPYAEKLAQEKFLREYEFLIKSAKEKYQQFMIENPELTQRLPDYHLASYLGISHVSLSRIKNARIKHS